MKYLVIIIFVLSFPFMGLKAKTDYCLNFNKDGKSLSIEQGKKISFLLLGDSLFQKGKIMGITNDSILIEEYKVQGLFNESESNYITTSYNINEFKVIGYNKTTRVLGGAAKTVLIVATTVITFGATLHEADSDKMPELFTKNIDMEDGWEIEIINCDH